MKDAEFRRPHVMKAAVEILIMPHCFLFSSDAPDFYTIFKPLAQQQLFSNKISPHSHSMIT